MPPTTISSVYAFSPHVTAPETALSTAAREAKAALDRLARSSESSVVFEGVVDKEDSQPWRHMRESHRHDYASGARWHSDLHLTLLNDGTLICSGISCAELRERHRARSSPMFGLPKQPPETLTQAQRELATLTSSNAFDIDISLPASATPPASPRTPRSPASAPAYALRGADGGAGGVSTPALRRLATAFPASRASRSSSGQTPQSSRASSYQAHYVPLGDAICIVAGKGVSHGKRKYGFIVRTRRRDNFFACLEEEEVEKWVDCINDACAALKGYAHQRHQRGHQDHHINPPVPVQAKQIMHSLASAQQLSTLNTLSTLTSFQRQLHRQSLETSRPASDNSSTPSLTPTVRAIEASDWGTSVVGRTGSDTEASREEVRRESLSGRTGLEASREEVRRESLSGLTGLSAALARASMSRRSGSPSQLTLDERMGQEDGVKSMVVNGGNGGE